MNQHKELELPRSELTRELRDYFPQLSSEDMARFEAHLHESNIADERNGYRLNFVGREYARLQTGLVSDMLISPDTEHNAQPANAQSGNVFITGDNLEALRHLQNAYAGKVKMIYIDPPYNTGKEFVYKDIFELSDEKLKIALGYSDEEIARLKSIQGKSSHSAWLAFMYPRLALAKKLLADDGVIFVSIDDNEQANLKLLMDDVFGEGNFVAQFIWEQGRKSMAAQVAVNHEYCLVFCKNKEASIKFDIENNLDNWKERKVGLDDIYAEFDRLTGFYGRDYIAIETGIREFYKKLPNNHLSKSHSHFRCVDENGLYNPDNISQGTGNGGRFNILHPLTGKPCKVPTGGWRFGENKLPELLKNNRIHFRKDETVVPCIKRYLKETESEVVASVFYKDGRGASSRLEQLFDGVKVFEYPKDEEVLAKFVSLVTSSKDALILDFFAGSGTTAHAVMQLNAEDGGNRRWMMVQWEEPTNPDSEARKTGGYDTIDQISRERIRRAGEKIKAQQLQKSPDLFAGDNAATIDTGFKHYRLVAPQIQTLDKIETFDPNLGGFEDMITPMGGRNTLLATWLIDDGYPFDTRVDEIVFEGYTAHYVGDDSQTLYLIDRGLTTSALKAMLNQIGLGKLIVSTIVVYPYSVEFEMMRELEIGVKWSMGLNSKSGIKQ